MEKEQEFACEPDDIDGKRHFFDAFGHNETEVSAGWIVRFCQQRNQGWADFTFADIDGYYQSKGLKDGFWFNRLTGGRFIIKDGDNYKITPLFVERCFKSSPAKKTEEGKKDDGN